MKFYDRKEELEFFKRISKTSHKKMISVYGRRRVGKTLLLKHAFPEAEYFFVDTRSSSTLLLDFSKKLIQGKFDGWEEFFKYLLEAKKTIIFDEFQNFIRVDKSIFSVLQKVWDELENDTKLILCGSYIGMMKRIFLDAKAPLFGRTSYNVNIKPFNFKSTYEMLRDFGYTFEESITWYSILGGIPKYLWYLEEKTSFDAKLYELFYSPFAPLKEEGKNMLVMEFGNEHPSYFAILKSIGNYDRKISEISDRSSLEKTAVFKYISELINRYDIVEKVENKLSRRKRGMRYRIKDNYLRFWYRFVYAIMDIVEFNPKEALKRALSDVSQHVGLTFEHIVTELLSELYKAGFIPCMPFSVGKSWGKMKDGSPYEIDMIGECEKKIMIFECKWTSKEINQKNIDELLRKMEYIKDPREKIPIIISKASFKKDTSNEVIKITLDDISTLF